MPPKINLRNYQGALQKMRDKGYSFREIALWATETLGIEVNRSQVVYILTADPVALGVDDAHEEEENMQDAKDEHEMAETTFLEPNAVPVDFELPPTLPKKAKSKKDKAKP